MTERRSTSVERILPGRAVQLPLVVALGSLRSRNASRITWHRHAAFEAIFMLDGATEYEFDDGRTVSLPGGHFLIVPPEARHRGLHDVRRPARLCGITFDPRRGDALNNTAFLRGDLRRLADQFKAHAVRSCPMSAELRRCVTSLDEQIQAFDAGAVDATAALRLAVCGTLLETARQLAKVRTVHSDEAVRAAMDFMRNSCDRPPSMSEVARAVGCSRARLFRIFRQTAGMTPNDYLQRLRVSRAGELLANTSRPVTEIAIACGFSSSQYFSNVFRKHLGQTPTAFRASGPGRKA
jgi:AraC family transcriptional regulator, melibiose operon regulatory protein